MLWELPIRLKHSIGQNKWPLALAATCSHLQPLAGTCSHLHLFAATGSHLQPLVATAPLAATCDTWLHRVAGSGCKWLHEQVAFKWLLFRKSNDARCSLSECYNMSQHETPPKFHLSSRNFLVLAKDMAPALPGLRGECTCKSV